MFFTIIFVTSLYTILGIALPGLALSCWLPNRGNQSDSGTVSTSASHGISYCFSLGILWNAFQYSAIILCLQCSGERLPLWGGVVALGKFIIDAVFILSTLSLRRGRWLEALRGFLLRRHWGEWLIYGVAIGYGTLAVLSYPHVWDTAQLFWTEQVRSGSTAVDIFRQDGGLAYSAILFFPGLFVPELPLTTMGAGYKVLYFLYLAHLGFSLFEHSRWRFILAFSWLVLVSMSHFAQIGISFFGKESNFAVLLGVQYVLSLIRFERSDHQRFNPLVSAVHCGAAVATGGVTIPFLAIFTFLYLVFTRFSAQALIMVIYELILGGAFAAVVFSAQLNMGIGTVFLVLLATITLCSILYLFVWKRSESSEGSFLLRWSALLFVGTVSLCSWLFPVTLSWKAYETLNGQTVMVSPLPFDGGTSFAAYLFSFNDRTAPLALFLALIGMCRLIAQPRGRAGLAALVLVFPVYLCLTLICAHWFHVAPEVTLWNMAKDLKNWWMGILFPFFAIILVNDLAGAAIRRETKAAIAAVLLFTSLDAIRYYSRDFSPNIFRIATTGRYAGFYDPEFVAVADRLIGERHVQRLFVPARTKFSGYANWFTYYDPFLPSPTHLEGFEEIPRLREQTPFFIILDDSWRSAIQQRDPELYERLEPLVIPGKEGVYRVGGTGTGATAGR